MIRIAGNPNRRINGVVGQVAYDEKNFVYYKQIVSPRGNLWRTFKIPVSFTSLTEKPTTLEGYGITDAIAISNTIRNVLGSVSGSADFAQPFSSPAYKRVTVYMRGLVGTAIYTFPVPFLRTPQILSDSASRIATVTLLSATAVTITGAGQTGFIELNGF